LAWYTKTYAEMPTANAVRWGTTYSFSFTSTSPPANGKAILHKFQPSEGALSELRANIVAPISQ
ncbi:hypothetical protein, partial [Phyllobacterium sp. P5_D12]